MPPPLRWPTLLQVEAPVVSAAALWVGAWLRGTAASDDLLCALARLAPDGPAVAHLDGAPPSGLADLLAHLRARGATDAWLLLPRPGQLVGWPPGVSGDPAAAVLVSDAERALGLLGHTRAGWTWTSVPEGAALSALRAHMRTARAGARDLASAVTSAAVDLEQLGLDRAPTRAVVPAWQSAQGRLPHALDPQVSALVLRIAVLRDALDLALAEPGAAVTAAEARARAARIHAVVGEVEDILCGIVGGLNATRVAWVG